MQSINLYLLRMLGYEQGELLGEHFNALLPVPARIFCQTHLFPILKLEGKAEEIFLALRTRGGEQVPVLLYAVQRQQDESHRIDIAMVPVSRRDEYENKILEAKKVAEAALKAKAEALAEKEKFERLMLQELQLARVVQMSFLPDPVTFPGIGFQAHYKASTHLSGDFYYWQANGENRYNLILADVMGHGVPSALIAMSIYTVFRRMTLRDDDPVAVVQGLNEFFLGVMNDSTDSLTSFTTLIYMTIDLNRKEIEYINAGHPAGLCLRPSLPPEWLPSSIPPIGILPLKEPRKSRVSLKAPARIYLYTDGILDNTKLSREDLAARLAEAAEFGEVVQELLWLKEAQETAADDQCLLCIDFSHPADS